MSITLGDLVVILDRSILPDSLVPFLDWIKDFKHLNNLGISSDNNTWNDNPLRVINLISSIASINLVRSSHQNKIDDKNIADDMTNVVDACYIAHKNFASDDSVSVSFVSGFSDKCYEYIRGLVNHTEEMPMRIDSYRFSQAPLYYLSAALMQRVSEYPVVTHKYIFNFWRRMYHLETMKAKTRDEKYEKSYVLSKLNEPNIMTLSAKKTLSQVDTLILLKRLNEILIWNEYYIANKIRTLDERDLFLENVLVITRDLLEVIRSIINYMNCKVKSRM